MKKIISSLIETIVFLVFYIWGCISYSDRFSSVSNSMVIALIICAACFTAKFFELFLQHFTKHKRDPTILACIMLLFTKTALIVASFFCALIIIETIFDLPATTWRIVMLSITAGISHTLITVIVDRSSEIIKKENGKIRLMIKEQNITSV